MTELCLATQKCSTHTIVICQDVIETNKGHKSILCEGFRYRLDVETRSGNLSWRCSAKGCKARVRTDAGPTLVIQQKNDHYHDPDDRGNERHVLRVNAKRKAVEKYTRTLGYKYQARTDI